MNALPSRYSFTRATAISAPACKEGEKPQYQQQQQRRNDCPIKKAQQEHPHGGALFNIPQRTL